MSGRCYFQIQSKLKNTSDVPLFFVHWFWEVRAMLEAWNKNMEIKFTPLKRQTSWKDKRLQLYRKDCWTSPALCPHSTLGKCWNALSYYQVHEAIAGGWLCFEHIPGTENPADVLTKSLAWNILKVYVKPLLFWKGEMSDAPPGSPNAEGSVTSPGHETPLVSRISGVVDMDVDLNHHNPGQD
eukprot:scaffold3362_cov154-Amphora_coffeaeformis.AAC.6